MKPCTLILLVMVFLMSFAAQGRDLFCSKVFRSPTEFEHSMKTLVDANLYILQEREASVKNARQIQANNERIIDNLLALEPRLYDPHPVTRKTAKRLLKEVRRKPVVRKEHRYERKDTDIGYCFGRAACAHFLALKHGYNKDQIKKVFVVGPMVNGATTWGYHVSFIVRGVDGEWWAVDNFTPKVLSVRDWYHYMLKMSPDGKLAFFVTEPEKMGALGGKYDRHEMGLDGPRELDFYKGYFPDLMKSIRE